MTQDDLVERVSDKVEAILCTRLYNKQLDGYTIEVSAELARAAIAECEKEYFIRIAAIKGQLDFVMAQRGEDITKLEAEAAVVRVCLMLLALPVAK